MAIVGRRKLNHPLQSATGGPTLYTAVETIYTTLSDDGPGRYFAFSSQANSTTLTLDHNFGAAFDQYTVLLYTGTHPNLTRVTNPTASGWTIAATGGFLKTKIDVTTPSSGGPHTFVVIVCHLRGAENIDDLDDVNLAVSPQDGQALVYDAATSKWIAGASGDASFKLQTISTPNATIKGGYLLLDDGRELATYDGSGALSTDFGTDQTVSLTTIFGSAPANATTYYLYVDLESLSAAVTTTDTGRKLLAVVEANYKLFTTTPDAINRGRYVHVGFVRSATSGTVWSGAGAAFGTLATRKHDNGPIAISPVAYRLAQQAVGAVGSSGQVAAGHLLTAKSFPSSLSTANRSWFPLAANGNDGSGNARTLTPNGSPVFTGTNILGSTNTTANLDGTDDNFSSIDAFFDPGDTNFMFGGWFAATDWTPAAAQVMVGQWNATGVHRVAQVRIAGSSSGNIEANFSTDGTANIPNLVVANPGFVDGSWHHFAIRYDTASKTGMVYIDGKIAATAFLGAAINTAGLGNRFFRVGANDSTAATFFAGKAEDVFFAQGSFSDDDIRKLYSYRVDHAKAVAAVNQQWDAAILGNCMTQDPSAWLVCKGDPDSVFWDFSDQSSTDSVSVTMQDTGLSAAVVQARQPFDTTYASGTAANAAIGAGLAHGQGEVPLIYLQREVNTGEWETMDPTGKIRADASNLITEDLTVITERVRVRAVGGVLPTAAGTATASTAGLVKRYDADQTTARLAVSADTTLTASDGISLVAVTTGATDRTVGLPAASGVSGREVTVKKIDAGAGKVIVDANGAETIDGATTTEITTQYAFVRVRSNGTSWEITG